MSDGWARDARSGVVFAGALSGGRHIEFSRRTDAEGENRRKPHQERRGLRGRGPVLSRGGRPRRQGELPVVPVRARRERRGHSRSEEHTSELQSRQYLVCRLLLEKKKQPIPF